MYEEGYLSLWLGNAESQSELKDYLELKYDEDGDLIPSQLIKDFNLYDIDGDLDEYDEGCTEISFLESKTNKISDILKKFSYEDQLLSGFKNLCETDFEIKINTAIVLFNYRNKKSPSFEFNGTEKVSLKFIGTIEYQM